MEEKELVLKEPMGLSIVNESTTNVVIAESNLKIPPNKPCGTSSSDAVGELKENQEGEEPGEEQELEEKEQMKKERVE